MRFRLTMPGIPFLLRNPAATDVAEQIGAVTRSLPLASPRVSACGTDAPVAALPGLDPFPAPERSTSPR